MHLSQVCLYGTPKGQWPSRVRQQYDLGRIEEAALREGIETPGQMAQGTTSCGLGTKDPA